MILENNLFGMEIDRRAAEIASFALEMKAREHDPRFFEREIDAHITVFDSVVFDSQELRYIGEIEHNRDLMESLSMLGAVGSLYCPDSSAVADVQRKLRSFNTDGGIFAEASFSRLMAIQSYLGVLASSYHCVITNPPYMTNKNITPSVSNWLSSHYSDERYDLCTCFISRGISFLKTGGYLAEITMQSWMFEASFERFRSALLDANSLSSLAHLGIKAFEGVGNDVVQTAAFVILHDRSSSKATFIKLDDCKDFLKKQSEFFVQKRRYSVNIEGIKRIPGEPLTAYWAPSPLFDAWQDSHKIEEFGDYTGSQNVTGNNNRYLRYFWEVSESSIVPGYWVPYAKGGNFRRYYGNITHVVDWRESTRLPRAPSAFSKLREKTGTSRKQAWISARTS